jgi:hypothetical protein
LPKNFIFYIYFKLSYEIYHKEGSQNFSRKVYFPDINACRAIDGLHGVPFFDMLLRDVKKNAPDLLEVCTRSGKIHVTNYSFFNTEYIGQFPAGQYRLCYKYFDEIDINIFNLTVKGFLIHKRPPSKVLKPKSLPANKTS